MTTIDQRATKQIQPELVSDESIIWAAMPNPKIIFHSDDWAAIPFSILWLGFFIFWEAEALGLTKGTGIPHGRDLFFELWGIPFLLIGNFMLWGRFLWDAWIKRRTYYAITNRRVILLQCSWKKRISSLFLRELPAISAEGTTIGTLWLGPKYPVIAGKGKKTRSMSRYDLGDVPVLADIDEVESVHRLLLELRAKESWAKLASDPLSYSPQE